MMVDLLNNFIILFEASAPWLLVGLLIAGLIQLFVPASLMSKQLGEEGVASATKAAFIGAPLPLCSCGVIPAAMGLRKAGASKSATTSFLVSTPETGVDSVTMSYVLLGPFMAVIRPVTAVVSAIVAGSLVGKDAEPVAEKSSAAGNSGGSCCASKVVEPEPEPEKTSCCSSKTSAKKAEQPSLSKRVIRSVHYSITDLLDSTVTWLLIGLMFAAMVQTWVPQDFLAQWGSGLIAMMVMVLISIPMYICATASTPVAVGLLLAGVSPGAVLVFMMAGPATNIATLGVVANELGRRAVAAYLFGVIATAMVFGWLTDYLVTMYGFEVAPQIGHEHQLFAQWFITGTSVILALLIVRNYLIRYGSTPVRKALWA